MTQVKNYRQGTYHWVNGELVLKNYNRTYRGKPTKHIKNEQRKHVRGLLSLFALGFIMSVTVAFIETTNHINIAVADSTQTPIAEAVDYSNIPYMETALEESTTEEVVSIKESVKEPHGIVLGYDIRSYATDKKHETKIANLTKGLSGKDTVSEIDNYIDRIAPKSQVTGEMVVNASKTYSVPSSIILAIMQNDSSFGTAGIGARTHNPGNVGNDDKGNIQNYKTWQAGVNAVANWLNNHK